MATLPDEINKLIHDFIRPVKGFMFETGQMYKYGDADSVIVIKSIEVNNHKNYMMLTCEYIADDSNALVLVFAPRPYNMFQDMQYNGGIFDINLSKDNLVK